MSKPFLSQIVNLCKEQGMRHLYVVEGRESRVVEIEKALSQYPDIEIDALTVEMFSTVDLDRSPVFYQTFKVFI